MQITKQTKANLDIFQRRKITYTLVFLVLIAVFAGASLVSEFNLLDGVASFPAAMQWIVSNLIPDAEAIERIPKILSELMETALVSVAVTVIAAVLAFFFSLLGSNITRVNRVVKRVVRIVAAFFRNVPDVVWAMLLMFSFGQNILTGFFALFFTTFGLLTRAFIETIDEVSSGCVEALDATGANFLQKVFQGILPSSMPGVITWVLYMIETNIRDATLVGILTGTGIGFVFDVYYKSFRYDVAGLTLVAIVIVVILCETLSNYIRRRIM